MRGVIAFRRSANLYSFSNLLMVGDSILAKGNTWPPSPPIYSPAWFWTLPQVVNDQAIPGQTLVNIANTTLSGILAAAPSNQDVILMAGANDFINGASLATVQAAFRSASDQIIATGRKTVVGGILPCKNGSLTSPAEWTLIEEYNAWLPGECAARGHVFKETVSYMQDPANPGNLNPAYIAQGDVSNYHLNPTGATVLANNLDLAFMQARRLGCR